MASVALANAIKNLTGQQRLAIMSATLGGVVQQGPSPREIELERQVAKLENERQFVALRQDFTDKIAEQRAIAIPRGSPEPSLSEQVLKVLLTQAFRDPTEVAAAQLELTRKQAEIIQGSNAFDLEKFKLQLRAQVYNQEREDRIASETAARREGVQQFDHLIEIGKQALTDAVKPITSAVGDGLRERVAHGGLPLPGTPEMGSSPTRVESAPQQPQRVIKSFEDMNDEERAAYRAQLQEVKAKLEQKEKEFAASAKKKTKGGGYGEVSEGA